MALLTDKKDEIVDPPVSSSFEEVFAPLAHHLFPDGAPPAVEIWPCRKDRSVVSAKDARAALENLRLFSRKYGLSYEQQWSVVIAACATLPKEKEDSTMTEVGAGSPLVEETCASFCALIKCLIPKETISFKVTTKLLSQVSTVTPYSRAKSAVLRLLTLAVRKVSLQNRNGLACLYGVIFEMVSSDSTVAPDAIRLLHALTRKRHVCVYRAKRLHTLYKEFSSDKFARACILLLLQLYAQYDPAGCGPYFPSTKRLGTAYSQCFKIPDERWEREFEGEYFHEGISTTTDRSVSKKRVNKKGLDHQLTRPKKRPRLMEKTARALEHTFEGVYSFSRDIIGNDSFQGRRHVRASNLLSDISIRNLVLLSSASSKVDKDVCFAEVTRLRACLPYLLHEEWYLVGSDSHEEEHGDNCVSDGDCDSNTDEFKMMPFIVQNVLQRPDNPTFLHASRTRVLEALASMALYADGLVPEAEAFVLEEVLPHWDGSDSSAVGRHLCHGLLPFLSPCSFSVLQSKVFVYLSPLLSYGSSKTQYAIVSGALTSLICRWGRLDWSLVLRKQKSTEDALTRKRRTLEKLIQWTEKRIQKALLVDGGGHELLCLASLNFFQAVAALSETCLFVATPNPSLVYRSLLSCSPLGIDRVCHLLRMYKKALAELKAINVADVANEERTVVFNSYIWDFCATLWRCSLLSSIDRSGSNKDSVLRTSSILYTDLSDETLKFLQEGQTQALSISKGASFCGHVRDFSEYQSTTMASDSFCGKKNVEYLDYLEKERGMRGLCHFLRYFATSLSHGQ